MFWTGDALTQGNGSAVSALEAAIAEAAAYSEGHEHSDAFRRILDHLRPVLFNVQATTMLDPGTTRRLRERLCFGHGHLGQYVDDGELQCQACLTFGACDYLRTPIDDLIDVLDRVSRDRLGTV